MATVEQTSRANQLQLVANVARQTYCQADAQIFTVHLILRLHYKNLSRQRIILLKPSYNISKGMLSRTLEDSMADKYEAVYEYSFVSGGEVETSPPATPNGNFVILKPGESYETDAFFPIGVTRDAGIKIPGTIPPGEHVLRVRVGEWPYSEANARKTRARWRKLGFLQSDSVTSEPVPFVVEANHPLSDCK